jgi:hypothetical protein
MLKAEKRESTTTFYGHCYKKLGRFNHNKEPAVSLKRTSFMGEISLLCNYHLASSSETQWTCQIGNIIDSYYFVLGL